MPKGSLFSTPSPAFIVCRFFDDGHSDESEVIPHSSFDNINLIHIYFNMIAVVALTNISAAAAAAAKSLQSCLTLCDPTDGTLPGSPVPGILQARTLEWVAISFSNA